MKVIEPSDFDNVMKKYLKEKKLETKKNELLKRGILGIEALFFVVCSCSEHDKKT